MLQTLAATGTALVVTAVFWLVGRWQVVREMRYNESVRQEVIHYHNTLFNM
jgi:hypothetical protein